MTDRTRRAARRAEAERNDQALLDAARAVLATEGAHASVAAIAARAGVGIGSLYRRYRTKEELFQRLCELSLDQWIEAAERGLACTDPWEGLASYITAAIEFGPGSLAPVAGTIPVTAAMTAKHERSDQLTEALVARAHAAGVLRPDATAVDISLLIEQLSKSPLIEQLKQQGKHHLIAAAVNARRRVVAVALDGLRAGHPTPLPGHPPGADLFHRPLVGVTARDLVGVTARDLVGVTTARDRCRLSGGDTGVSHRSAANDLGGSGGAGRRRDLWEDRQP